MSIHTPRLLAAAAALACTAAASETPAVQTITITGSAAATAPTVAGFGEIPLARSPFSATVIGTAQLADAGIGALADITRLDAGLTDAYNAPGYWGQVAVRGYTLDNRANFRRDGLPVNAETVLPTGNKAALELFKGTSGVQAGISSPGGLLNLVVKRPLAQSLTAASLEWIEPGTLAVEADLSRRHAGGVGWRLSAGATRLDPATRASRGEAHLLALALDAPLGDGLVEFEIEDHRQSQPSTPGFSLLGERLPSPDAIDPTLNLNNQPWTLPVVFRGRTASVRLTHALDGGVQLGAHAMRQQLVTDDRIAFPYGCSAEGNFDRYCSDGRFDFYDFRSDDERRTSDALDLTASGRAALAGIEHRWSAGVLFTRHAARFGRQAFNYVGEGRLDGRAVVPPDPALTDENTHRDERSTEWRVTDVMTLAPAWQLWAGLRHTRLDRASVRTDGSRATDVAQSFTTPWLALAWQASPALTAYASWGEGVETDVAPNRARYTNAGQPLPALKSRQLEFGLKHRSRALSWQLAAFDIRRPLAADLNAATGLPSDACSDADPCTRRIDGAARHRGLEAEAEWRAGALGLRGSALWLQARREGAADAAANGLQPTNVPDRSLKLQAAWNVAAVPGLALLAFASHEGERAVTPDNRVFTDGWTRIDLGLRYTHTALGTRWVWRAGIDNLADERAWKESPFQFGHAYLYPLAPRTARVALQVTL